MRLIRSFKLVQFCLHVIVENLTKFIACPNVPQKHIEFLLRVYSEEIFKRFGETNCVSEECVLWFLKPYSKKVAPPFLTPLITNQLLIIGPAITSLDLSETFDTGEDTINAIVRRVPNVTFLDLSLTECSNRTLSLIRKECPALLSLKLVECERITDEGLEIFCEGNRTLKRLNLVKTRIQERGLLVVLNEMPQLECLKCTDLSKFLYSMKKDSKLLHSSYSLTELFYEHEIFGHEEGVDMTAEILHTWTVLCPNIRKVMINFELTEKSLEMCTRFQYLEYLEINFQKRDSYEARYYKHDLGTIPVSNVHAFNVADNVLASLLPLVGRLTVLKLSVVNICTKLLIEQFHGLKVLGLREVTFSDFDEGDISLKENCLETLVIENVLLHVPSTCKSIQLLLSLSKRVTNLRLNDLIQLPDSVIDVILTSMKGLSVVDFSNTPITGPSASRFAGIPSVTAMHFAGCWTYYPAFVDATGFKQTQSFLPTNTLAWNWCNADFYDDTKEETFFHFSA